MSKTIVWDSEGYWLKAKVYINRANKFGPKEWEHPFWSALSLELLARAALTKVHPVLNADPQNEGANILHALGFEIKGHPKAIPVHAVIVRLGQVIKGFDKPHKIFCEYFFLIRNEELHTSELPYLGLNLGKWQARYYDTCKVLCESLNKTLEDFLGDKELSKAAEKIIKTAKSQKIGKVKKMVSDLKKTYDGKTSKQKDQLLKESIEWTRFLKSNEIRVKCPACNCWARVEGDFVRESEPIYEEDFLHAQHFHIAKRMECKACGLILGDIEEIQIAGVEPSFSTKVSTSLHELFQPEYEYEYNNM